MIVRCLSTNETFHCTPTGTNYKRYKLDRKGVRTFYIIESVFHNHYEVVSNGS